MVPKNMIGSKNEERNPLSFFRDIVVRNHTYWRNTD
jgi:hypothetical protein